MRSVSTLPILLLLLAAMASAKPSYLTTEEPARYDFSWAVKDDYSGNNYGQNESRDGPHTSGSYYVLLPDGRIQRVTYTVDGQSGFVAHVTYETPGGGYSKPAAPIPSYKG